MGALDLGEPGGGGERKEQQEESLGGSVYGGGEKGIKKRKLGRRGSDRYGSRVRLFRTSLVAQGLRLRTSNVWGVDSVPGQGTKIAHSVQSGQKKKKKFRVRLSSTTNLLYELKQVTFFCWSFNFRHKTSIILFHWIVMQRQGNKVCKELGLCLTYTHPL